MTQTEALRLALEALENHIEDPRCDKLIEELIAAIKAALEAKDEPVAYQCRTRPNWKDESCWTPWKNCLEAEAQNCWNRPQVLDWLYEARALYTTPPQRTEQGAVIDHSCKDTYELIMKWADIYAAQTGELYSQAARDPSRAAKMADERTMLACVVAQAFPNPAAPVQEPVAWMEMVVANLVREGVNKHKARELAQHFYTTPPAESDLLNALKRIVDEPNNTMSDGKALKEIIRIARLAIAKATGEQP